MQNKVQDYDDATNRQPPNNVYNNNKNLLM
jgi:hypothetical protein